MAVFFYFINTIFHAHCSIGIKYGNYIFIGSNIEFLIAKNKPNFIIHVNNICIQRLNMNAN